MTQQQVIKALKKAKQSYLNRTTERIAVDSELHQEVINAYNYTLNLMKKIDKNDPTTT